MIRSGPRHEVVSNGPGHLVEYLASPEDRVEPGAPIARQTTPALEREIAALRDRIGLLEGEFGGGAGAGGTVTAAARARLLELETRRSGEELIVTHERGEVMPLLAAPGDYLPPGAAVARIRGGSDASHEAVAAIAARVASSLEPGDAATVVVSLPDGSEQRLAGSILRVAAGRTPGWLVELGLLENGLAHRVHVILEEASGVSLPDGAVCRVRLALGRDTPAALLAPRGS